MATGMSTSPSTSGGAFAFGAPSAVASAPGFGTPAAPAAGFAFGAGGGSSLQTFSGGGTLAFVAGASGFSNGGSSGGDAGGVVDAGGGVPGRKMVKARRSLSKKK